MKSATGPEDIVDRANDDIIGLKALFFCFFPTLVRSPRGPPNMSLVVRKPPCPSVLASIARPSAAPMLCLHTTPPHASAADE